MSHCRNCELKIDWVDEWCPRCGARFHDDSPEANERKVAAGAQSFQERAQDVAEGFKWGFAIKIVLSMLFIFGMLLS